MQPLDELARHIAVMKWRGEDRVYEIHRVLYDHTVDIFMQIRKAIQPVTWEENQSVEWLAAQLERLATQIPKPVRSETHGKSAGLPTE